MQRKRVCVIGAAGSGLPSIRHALLQNCEVTCYEGSNYVGGLWRYKPEETNESSVMKSTVINSSKEMTAFSDFPPEPEMANYMHNTQMYKYLMAYAEKYDLYKYIKFNHMVHNVERAPNYKETGEWIVSFSKNGEKKIFTETFDGVLVCTGHHTHPHYPKPWPGQEYFKGRIMHSHSYKDHRGFEDRTVVIVGVGNSGGDIAVELSRIAKQVYLVTRRGTWVLNRIYDYGDPTDFALISRYMFFLRDLVPASLSNWAVESKLQKRFDHERYGLKPKHRVFSAHPTINDDLPCRIACGSIKIKPNIKKFTETSIVFEDGTTVDHVDDVILSTGFSFDFPILEKGNLIPVVDNSVELYKYMYPVNIEHNTLAIIGLIQPLGSIMPISEMQARLFLGNITGNISLPSKREMQADIKKKHDEMSKVFVKSRRHTIQVDYLTFMDELAELVGCYPNLKTIAITDPCLFAKIWFGPNLPYVYRLVGPHKWEGAREAIMTAGDRCIAPTNKNYHPCLSTRLLNFNPVLLIGVAALAVIVAFLLL